VSAAGERPRRSGAAVAVAEQLAYTGTQFLFNLGLARLLDPADYGRYALNVPFVILASVIHFCFVFEAAQVNGGAAAARFMLAPFVRTTAASLGIAAAYFCATGAAHLVAPSAVFLAGYNALWMARSAAQLQRAFGASLAVCLAAAGLYLGALAAVHLLGTSVAALLVALGVAKLLLAGAVLAARRAFSGPAAAPRPGWRRWYGFGLESFAAQVLIWSVLNVPVLYLGSRQLLTEAAYMNVVYTFLVPCQSVFMALSSFYTPAFVQLAREPARARRLLARFAAGAGAMAGGYSLLLLVAGSAIAGRLFGARFAGLELAPFALVPLLLSQISALRTFHKASGRVRDTLLAAIAGAAITAAAILAGAPASHGAVAGGVVAAYGAVVAVLLARALR
jgi:O-antigen/teichoic acid export membrane protein